MKRTGACLAALLGVALASPAALSQWVSARDEGQEGPGPMAWVRNEDGARLRIWVDAESQVHAAFTLPRGLLALDPAGCPSLQVDQLPMQDLAAPEHECSVENARAKVVLARASDGHVDSPTLLNLMNGTRLTVRYRLIRGGYGTADFSLRGSKQALTDALGEEVQVTGD
jgi:hypothetical protein